MPQNAGQYFRAMGENALLPENRKPSKTTIKDGKHLETEDERTPDWRKEVCDALAERAAHCTISDELIEVIRVEIAFAANFLSVGSRDRLILKIETMVLAEQLSQAAE